MHEYLPGMAEQSFGAWIAFRRAVEDFEAGAGPAGAVFTAGLRLAGRTDVAHDAPTAAARGRWHAIGDTLRLAAEMHHRRTTV